MPRSKRFNYDRKSTVLLTCDKLKTNNCLEVGSISDTQTNDEHDDPECYHNQGENVPNQWRNYLCVKRKKFDDNYEENRKYLRSIRERAIEIQKQTGQKFYIDPPINRYSDVPLGDPKWRICDPESLSPIKDYTVEIYKYLNKFYFGPEDPILSTLFEGICIFVNGYTNPVASTLHTIMLFTGGRYTLMFDNRRTTHTIATVLSMSQRKSERAKKTTVKPEWIIDSLRAQKLLPLYEYLVAKPKNGIREMFARLNQRQEEKQDTFEGNKKIQATIMEKCLHPSSRPNNEHHSSIVSFRLFDDDSNQLTGMKENEIIFDEDDLKFKFIASKSKCLKSYQPPSSSIHKPVKQELCDINQSTNKEKYFNQFNDENQQKDKLQRSPELIGIFDDDVDISSKSFQKNDDLEVKFYEILNGLDITAKIPKPNYIDSDQFLQSSNNPSISLLEFEPNKSIMFNNIPKNIRYENKIKYSENNSPIKTAKNHVLFIRPLSTMEEVYKGGIVDNLFIPKSSPVKLPSGLYGGAKGKRARESFRKNLNLIKAKVTNKKQLRIDFMLKREMLRASNPKHQALDIYLGRRGSREPNICGKTSFKDVSCLLEEWIVTSEKLNDLDVTYVLKYLFGLIDGQRLQDLKKILTQMKEFILYKCDQTKPIFSQWIMMFGETFQRFLRQEPSIPKDLFSDSLFNFTNKC